jgi:lipopolysaccharide transport system permease protein
MQLSWFTALLSRRSLLFAWALRTIRGRYQQSFLGGVWAIIQPLTTVLLFTVIFTKFIPIETGDIPYVVFSYSAMVPWLLFSSSITDMVDSLVVNMTLVTKIYFPREILPLAAMLARLVDFGIAYALLIIIMMIYQMQVFSIFWLFLPLIILIG